MKSKIITLLILVSFFAPMASRADMEAPFINLTVIVNTQGQDSSFHFSFYSGGYNQEFDVQTDNLSGVASATGYDLDGSYAEIIETPPSGIKVESIQCIGDSAKYNFHYNPKDGKVYFTGVPYSNVTCIFNNINVVTKNPVLIVPGLVGTNINKNDDKIWLNLAKNFTDIGDQFMDVLQFNDNLSPIINTLSIGDVIKRETFNVGVGDITIFDYTEGLIKEFEGQGYIEGETLFTFPYDWRYGVSGKYTDGKTNSDLLKDKIAQILTQTGSDKIDVVAHSMGGLIVKKYVMDNSTGHKIDKAVFVGVPNTGAPKSVKTLLQGDSFGVPWLADSEVKKISKNMPASYDLLPSQEYYNQKGSFVQVIDEGNEWPPDLNVVIDDLNYQEMENYLVQDHSLNSIAFNNAEALHTQEFDNYDLTRQGIDLYSIVGCKNGTLGKITERRYADVFGSQVAYQNPKYFPGDGTVPLESATNLPIKQANKFYLLSSKHSRMMTADGSRQKIVNLISGSNLSVGSSITQDISQCNLNGKAISVYSPVDIFVTDQSGNKLGLAEDGSIVNEIPGADFEVWGEHKFVFIPQDGGENYSIGLDGTASGTFTIKSQDISGSQTGATEVFESIPVTDQLTGQINLSGESTTLSIKETPQSAVKTIYPKIEGNNFPKNKDQCKKMGWKKFDGKFKNQGQCEKFVKPQKTKK